MSDKPRKSPSGLRSVTTLQQAMTSGGKPRGRHQVVSRFARLEGERARLERELGMWNSRRQATQEKLAKVYEQIDALKPLLLEEPAKTQTAGKSLRRKGKGSSTETSRSGPPARRSIALDY